MAKVLRKKAEWSELLTKQASSGQGVKEWCEANGINVNSMYNQIAKHHKELGSRKQKRTSKTNRPMQAKTISNEDKPVAVEWKEIKTTAEQHREAIQRGGIYIEIGGMRLAADAGYPVAHLAALCKELSQTC